MAKKDVEKEGDNNDSTYSGGGSFILIEIFLVIGFITMAAMMTYIMYSKVSVSNAVNIEVRNLETLRTGAKNLFAAYPNYNNINANILNDARITPYKMVSGKNIVNSFGGAVTIAPVSLDGETNNAFSITYTEISAHACSKLVATVDSQFDAVKVEDTTVKSFGSNNLDIGAVASACTKNDAPKTVVFSSL